MPFRKIVYADFTGGLNNRLEPHLLQPTEAQTCENIDLDTGILRPVRDVTTTTIAFTSGGGTTPSSTPNWIHYAAGTRFIHSADFGGQIGEYRFALNDGNKTYITRRGRRPSLVSPSSPVIGQDSLGLSPPTFGTVTITGAVGSIEVGEYRYALTIETADGLESNPSEVAIAPVTAASSRVEITNIQSNITPRALYCNIYRTTANGGVLYFLGRINPWETANPTYTDNASDIALDTTRQIYWNVGGFVGSGGQYTEDHSPPPNFTCISQAIHSVSQSGRPGAGFAVGAIGSTVYWSMLGFPDYWPVVNSSTLPEKVEAILSWLGMSFVFTANAVFQIRGSSDSDVSVDKTKALFGVIPGLGRTAKLTPYGILFVAREGLALFDGSDTQIISASKLSRSYLRDLHVGDGTTPRIYSAEYFDGRYYLFHNTGCVRFDLRDGVNNLRITTLGGFTSTPTYAQASCVGLFQEPVLADRRQAPPGYVDDLVLLDPGVYDSTDAVPAITFGGGGGTGAAASVVMSVHSCVINASGSGYTSAPNVAFSAPASGGKQALGYAEISGASVVSVIVTEEGSGYTSAPTATISGGGGSSATVFVRYKISGLRITNAGSGYTSPPSVTVGAGTITRAKAQAIVTPTEYRFAGLVSDNSTLLFRIGGLVRDKVFLDLESTATVDRFDTSSELWATRAAMGAARHNITPVYVGGLIYVYGGSATNNIRDAADATLRIYNVAGNSWDETRTAQTPGSLTGYASATNGIDVFFYGGNNGSGTVQGTLWRYNVSADNWTNLGTSTALYGAAMVIIGTTAYIVGGSTANLGTSPVNTVIAASGITTGAATFTTDSTGSSAGFTARCFASAISFDSKVWILGGFRGQARTTGEHVASAAGLYGIMSDVWEYDPSATPTFVVSSGEVVGLGDRCFAGTAAITSATSGAMYLFGGASSRDFHTSDLFTVEMAALADNTRTPGVYVVLAGATVLRRLEGDTTDMAITWRGREEISSVPGPPITFDRYRIDHMNNVTVSTVSDAGGAVTQHSLTTGGGIRQITRRWFTSGTNKPDGQRVALQLTTARGTAIQVHRVEIDVKEEGALASTS